MKLPGSGPEVAIACHDDPDLHAWAAELGREVARGNIGFSDAMGVVEAMPGPPGSRRVIDPRHPGSPIWVTDLPDGRASICGLHTRLAWTLRDAVASAELALARQADDARKAVGPALARGLAFEIAIDAARAAAPDLHPDEVDAIVDEESAWWLRWRHDRAALVDALA